MQSQKTNGSTTSALSAVYSLWLCLCQIEQGSNIARACGLTPILEAKRMMYGNSPNVMHESPCLCILIRRKVSPISDLSLWYTCLHACVCVFFHSGWGRGQGGWFPSAALQERGDQGNPGPDEMVRHLSLLQAASLLALQRLWQLCGGVCVCVFCVCAWIQKYHKGNTSVLGHY